MSLPTFLPVNTVKQVDNYPYGRLQATVFFSIEYNRKKGYRTCFQSINPKNGVLNAKKYDTYDVLALYYINEDGHVKSKNWNSYNARPNDFLDIIQTQPDVLPAEQKEDLLLYIMAYCKANFGWATAEKKPFYQEMYTTVAKNLKTPEAITYRFPEGFHN